MEPDNLRDKWIVAFIVLFFAGCIVAICSGCASVNQRVTTMDGDTFEQRGVALLSKQDIAQKSSAEFFPNNSGAVIGLNTDSTQDSTEAITMLKALVALGQAFASPGIGGGGVATQPEPSTIGRATNMLEEIAALRAQVEAMRELYGNVLPTRPKAAVGPGN